MTSSAQVRLPLLDEEPEAVEPASIFTELRPAPMPMSLRGGRRPTKQSANEDLPRTPRFRSAGPLSVEGPALVIFAPD